MASIRRDPTHLTPSRPPLPAAFALVWLLSLAPGVGAEEPPPTPTPGELKKLSLEELVNTEFTSLSKKAEKRTETPAAAWVITGDDIRRSGATNLPDALRLAPGVHVARINSNQWAVGIRGFASRASRSQLVLIDGRSVYTPLFAGVFWEEKDTLLEDVDRIEVIRGPGGTLWGANAVNGIVNVLTKSAKDTQGLLASGGGGSEERGFGGFRYGGRLGRSVSYRIYGKYFDRDGGLSRGLRDFDDWRMGQVGFRSDTDLPGGDLLTVQGDLYDGHAGERATITELSPPSIRTVEGDADLSGGNLLGRWTRTIGDDSELAVQVYYDRTFRRQAAFREERDTYDVDLQHSFPMFARQEVIWGLGYRLAADDTGGAPFLRFVPASRDLHLFSGFIQDTIPIGDSVRLTVGSKLEHNDYSGFELQPSGRVIWTPADDQSLWASFTRAVRTPSRIDRDLDAFVLLEPSTPTFIRLIGDGGFESEKVYAYEAGYRIRPVASLFVDLAGFYSRYADFQSVEPGTPVREESPPRVLVPFLLRNKLDAEVYGGELGADGALLDWWRLGGSYSYLQLSLTRDPGGQNPNTEATERSSPHHMVSFRSLMDLPRRTELDLWLRYVDSLRGQRTSSYVTLDLRIGWKATDQLELSAVGQNLLEPAHLEFGGASATPVEVERGGYGKLVWRW